MGTQEQQVKAGELVFRKLLSSEEMCTYANKSISYAPARNYTQPPAYAQHPPRSYGQPAAYAQPATYAPPAQYASSSSLYDSPHLVVGGSLGSLASEVVTIKVP